MESNRGLGCSIFAGLAIVALIIFGIFQLIGWETVDAGNVGIVVNYRKGTADGKPHVTTYYPGRWFWVSPTTEKKYQYPISEQTINLIRRDGNGGVLIQDKNGNGLAVDVSMYWAVDQARVADLFLLRPNMPLISDNGVDIETQIVQRELVSASQIVAGQYRYDEIFAEKRSEYATKVEELVRANLNGSYVSVNRVVVGTVHPNEQQAKAIAQKADAEQAAIRAKFLEEQRRNEANAAVAEAEGKRLIAEKETQTQVAQLAATTQAEEDRIRKINAAIASSPEYLRWFVINKWDGKQPNTVMFGGDGGSNYHILVPTP